MAETPEAEIIAESFSIGDRMAEDVMRDLNEARHAPEYRADHIVSSIAAQINVADSQLYGLWLAGYDDKGLSELLAPYVDRFLKFLRREDFRDTRNLPLLIARTNDTSVLVPVDVASLRRSS